jgi:NAD(P)-dependent dehydrogenase (short-subunit alcohol dehydrogenase family)
MGCGVVVADVEPVALAQAAERLRAEGTEVLAAVVDVRQADQVQALAERAIERFGAILVACNNAGAVRTPARVPTPHPCRGRGRMRSVRWGYGERNIDELFAALHSRCARSSLVSSRRGMDARESPAQRSSPVVQAGPLADSRRRD